MWEWRRPDSSGHSTYNWLPVPASEALSCHVRSCQVTGKCSPFLSSQRRSLFLSLSLSLSPLSLSRASLSLPHFCFLIRFVFTVWLAPSCFLLVLSQAVNGLFFLFLFSLFLCLEIEPG